SFVALCGRWGYGVPDVFEPELARQVDVVDVLAAAADETRVFLALDRVAHATDLCAGAGCLCLCRHLVTPRSAGRDRHGAGRLCLGGSGHLAGRLLDRLDDVHVSGTATQVAADPLADLVLGRRLVLAEEPGSLHDHARGAEAALEAVLVPERLLERVEGGAVGPALDGLDLSTVGLDRQHRA